MKKIVVFLMLLVLVGCSSKSDPMVCTLEEASAITTVYEIEYDDDDKIVSIEYTQTAAIPGVMFERFEDTEELRKLYESEYINPNVETEGIEFKVTLDDKEQVLKVVATIDIKDASEANVKSSLAIKDIETVTGLSSELKGKGYTCKPASEQ